MDAHSIIEIIGIAITLIGAFWKFNEMINKRFEHSQKNQTAAFNIFMENQKKSLDRVYERMDERNEEAHKTFVRLDVHNMSLQNLEEKTGDKFQHTIQVFELKLEALTKAVNMLMEKHKEAR